MSIEAMKQALEALERAVSTCFDRRAHEDVMSRPEHFINQTITTLRTAIAEAESVKPIAWANINKHGDITHTNNKRMPWSKTPLYTTPPAQPAKQEPVATYTCGVCGVSMRMESVAAQRQWVGLTDEEIREIVGSWAETPIKGYTRKLFDQIEAKLKEKNSG